MTLKILAYSTTNRSLHMGRRIPRVRHYGLRLGNYLDLSKIELPDEVDYTAKAMPCLDQMLMNDQLGCCAESWAFRADGVFQANAGHPNIKFTNAQIVAFYSAVTGYDPHNPSTDQGTDLVTMLNYWRTHSLYKKGHELAGHASVDGTNWDLVCAAVELFENLCFGEALPDAYVSPPPDAPDWTWDVAGEPDLNNGHCFGGFGYKRGAANKIRISTWAMLGWHTKDAVAKYTTFANGGELHTGFSYDAIDKASKKAPNGLMADELYADLKKFGAAA